MADIQELRWSAFVADKADRDPRAAREAAHTASHLCEGSSQYLGPGPHFRICSAIRPGRMVRDISLLAGGKRPAVDGNPRS